LKNVTYIISNIDKAYAFEWISKQLDKKKFTLSFILLNSGDSCLEDFLREENIPVTRIEYRGKRDLLRAVLSVYNLLKNLKTDIVHTHLFDANLIGLFAARLALIKKRIYTRHHSDFHHLYYPKMVKYDRIINYFATDIIAISEIVKNILINKEGVSPKKIHLIHHGFDIEKFKETNEINIKKIREKYLPVSHGPVIGVISRFIELKGIQFIIPAFEKFLTLYPDAVLVLANATGNYKKAIHEKLKHIPPNNYVEIPFETDIFSLYKIFDVFIHVPINHNIEAFGQTYIEALATGTPSIFTLSGVANEFIIDKYNALVVPFEDSDAIFKSMLKLNTDPILRKTLIENGEKSVNSNFTLLKMISALEELYVK
jgi:glycosyltransferase involved in cell wall biosynthesis